MHARVTTIEMDPGNIDQAVSQLEERDLPTIKELDGFRGFTLVADRSSGRVIATSYWDDESKMQASEDAVKEARERAADTGGGGEPQIDRGEVEIDTFVR